MNTSTPNAPVQPVFPFFAPTSVERRGDEFVVKVGKPVAWLTVAEFGRAVGLRPKSIYVHIGSEALPERFVEYTGGLRIRISAEAVEFWRSYWKAKRGLAA